MKLRREIENRLMECGSWNEGVRNLTDEQLSMIVLGYLTNERDEELENPVDLGVDEYKKKAEDQKKKNPYLPS